MSGTGSQRALGAHQTGFSGARAGEPSLKRDSPHDQQSRFHILSNHCALSSPSPLRFSVLVLFCFPPPQSPWPRWFVLSVSRPRRRSTRCTPARMERAGVRREDPGRHHPPRRDLVAGEFVLFVSYLSCGLALPISPFFLLLLEEFRLQLQHLTPHSILQVAIFVHLCEMFVGVAACTSLFRQFFVLVRSGKGKDHLGAYYFQTRSDPTAAYIATLGGARWENWHNDWVIASAEVNDRLALPNDEPRRDRKQWRAKPSLAPEFEPVLDRIKELATGGLTSMHVVGDFLKRRVMPLQGRPHLCCWYTGPNDISRVQRGPETDLSWERC
jgi:hypothetical protein